MSQSTEPSHQTDFSIGDVIIRGIRPDDAEAATRVLNMPGVRHGTLRQPFQSISQTHRYIEELTPADIVIVAEWHGIFLGQAGLYAQRGRRRHAASLGLGIHDDFTGKGIGNLFLKTLLDAADNWHDLKRIELNVFTDNLGAVHLYEKFGFAKEGVMRQYAFRNGTYADCYLMARLR
ncbi:GNAT family N-acetyltransferase [Agrobacterium larrymoorei]|uniref:GNAT family N-acetyltransferase n=1 Tax=Agrobacterium larrymoorei TaxID=160699 RepID=UPI0015730017|nr:GNAT family N-acetyltransferase [Agrobacterium larrymoorei]NTJ42813.1 GNAT family N-acetyltransferase [Agrobacterium larrymoorei]